MPRTYEVTDIDWDTDDEEVEGLPDTATVEVPDDEDEEDDEDYVTDDLSDEHGWCISDCKIRRVDQV